MLVLDPFQDCQFGAAVSSFGSPGCPCGGTRSFFNMGLGTYDKIVTQECFQGIFDIPIRIFFPVFNTIMTLVIIHFYVLQSSMSLCAHFRLHVLLALG